MPHQTKNKKINDLRYPENEIWEKPNWSLNKAPNDFDESLSGTIIWLCIERKMVNYNFTVLCKASFHSVSIEFNIW